MLTEFFRPVVRLMSSHTVREAQCGRKGLPPLAPSLCSLSGRSRNMQMRELSGPVPLRAR